MHAQTEQNGNKCSLLYNYRDENLASSRGRVQAMGTPPHKLSAQDPIPYYTTLFAYKVYLQLEYFYIDQTETENSFLFFIFRTISQLNRYIKFCGYCVIVLILFQAKPSQAVVAAKRNARMRQANNKKIPDIVIKDIYHAVR
jgi:hypothetical protein